MGSPIHRFMVVGAIFYLGLCALSAFAFDGSTVTKGSRAAGLDACVAPTEDMRRNHMDYIKHQRDLTVHQGIRGSKFSITGCVNCHTGTEDGKPVPINSEGQFCQQCHSFAAVSIDCFQCHRKIPAAAPAGGAVGDLIPADEVHQRLQLPLSKEGIASRQSVYGAQEDRP